MSLLKVTSSDICMALKLRYPRQSHALMFEVAPTTGGGTRYADAVAVGLWASHGHAIEGIEVKVCRSDFLNEMKQPEKSQPVFQYCNRWWLACPKDMVKPDELPATWGLLELCGDTLRQKVKAPKLQPARVTVGFFASMIRRQAGMDEEMAAIAMQKRVAEIETRTKANLERQYRDSYNHRVQAAEAGMAIIEKVKAETGIDLTEYGHRDDGLLQAVKLFQSLSGDWRGLKELRRNAEALIKAVDDSGLLAPPIEQVKAA